MNVARTLETGSILGVLSVVLVVTGLLISPTVGAYIPNYAFLQAEYNFQLYVTHLATAALLVAFTVWHLLPFGHQLKWKKNVGATLLLVSYVLLATILVEIATGAILYLHLYDLLDKRLAVLVHLATTFVLLLPLAWHTWRGIGVWQKRRAGANASMAAATAKGKGEAMAGQRSKQSRRQFLRLSAYGLAGLALAGALGKFTAGQLSAWRLNFVGKTPEITKESYRLRVTGLVANPVELTFAELRAMPSQTVRITHHCVEGWTYTDDFTGVPLKEVIARAGGALPTAKQFIFKSPEVSQQRNGGGLQYTSNFPVADAVDGDALVVYAVQGEDLPPEHGFPVRLMTPGKWGYKACKWMTEIEATGDAEYQGYWERLGYHNKGDYPGPIFA